MSTDYDIVIAGAGLAGVCSALHLVGHKRILLVDSADPPAGASSAAAGLVNPFMARKARPVRRHEEALRALRDTLELVGQAFDERGVIRPARDEEQAGYFRATADRHESCHWLPPAEGAQRYPEVASPHGSLFVSTGGAVDISRFVDDSLRRLEHEGSTVKLATTLTSFDEIADGVEITLETTGRVVERVACSRLLLAMGAGFESFPELENLGLHAVKGQTVEVRPRTSLSQLPHVAGQGYIVFDGERAIIGSSFQHEFDSTEPDAHLGKVLLDRATRTLPGLEGAEIVRHHAGIRVTVRAHRLPIVGPLPGRTGIWTFTGLGSKGLLMAPLVATHLSEYLRDPGLIPPEFRIPE